MTNRRLLVLFLTALVVLTSATLPFMMGCTEPAPAETIELTFPLSALGLAGSPEVAMGGWMDEVEEISGGGVKFTTLVGAVTDEGMYDSLIAGAGDVAGQTVQNLPGRFPCLEMMTISDMGTVCQKPSQAAWELWEKFPEIQEEFSETKLLAVWAASPSPPGIGFVTGTKPIYTLEDFQGMKMGIYGAWTTKTVEALGAVPATVPPGETYESVQRGIVDGTFCAPEMLVVWNLQEVAKYYNAVCFQFVPFYLAMNWDSWNSLPSDVQEILEEAAANIPERVDAYSKESMQEIIDAAVANYGLTVIEFTPEEIAKCQARQDPVQDEYIAMLEEKGINGREILDELQRLYAKYAE